MSVTNGVTFHLPRRSPREKFDVKEYTLDLGDDEDALDEIKSLTWNIFGVSALFGFQRNDKRVLKSYGKRLREEIAANLPQENVAYDASISVPEKVLESDSVHLPWIKVDVSAKKVDEGEDGTEKSIYKGLLLSLNIDSGLNLNDSIKLPLLLCRGTRSCMRIVHSTLCQMFDCLITALPMEEDDLMWLIPIIMVPFSTEEYPTNRQEVRLEYIIPGLPKTEKIIVTLGSLDLVKILDSIIKDPDDDETSEINLTIEHIKRFRKCLQNHIRNVAGLELGLCTLHRFNLPAGAVMDNKMKITDLEIMKRVLLYMIEKALDMFHVLPF